MLNKDYQKYLGLYDNWDGKSRDQKSIKLMYLTKFSFVLGVCF